METTGLIKKTIENLKNSYSPYSGFAVSAVLLCRDGSIYTGVNIENAAYSASVCAERSAFIQAVNEGKREFDKIIICGGHDGRISDYCPPCGVCRQVMREFCNPDSFKIILAKSEDDWREFTLEEMLPLGFGPDYLS